MVQNISWPEQIGHGLEQQRAGNLGNAVRRICVKTMRVILQADQRQKKTPQKRDFARSSTRSMPIGERTWTDVEPGKQSLSDFSSVEEIDPSSSSWKPTSRQ